MDAKETPPLKLRSNSASGVKDFLRKSLGGGKETPSSDVAEKIKEIEENAKKEEEVISKKEFESREERHAKRTKMIMNLILGEDEEEEKDEVLVYPTAPDKESTEGSAEST